jgi:N-acetylglucosamine-6-phosphate deacetylase
LEKIKKAMITRFFNGKILKDHSIKQGDLWVADGKIISPASQTDKEIDLNEWLVAPGYIDLQINGGFGRDFSTDEDAVEHVAARLPTTGVTSFLATMVTSDQLSYHRMLPHLLPRKTGLTSAECLGTHLEGPFFNPMQIGAHAHEFIVPSFEGIDSLEDFYGNLKGVKMVTLAPELPGALRIIEDLTQKNIIVAVGHTMANYHEMQTAVKAGVKMVTHLFNRMTPFHHRAPGILGETLTNPSLYYSIIADAVHLHPAAIYIAWKSNPAGLILVTDGHAALGLPEGNYNIGPIQVIVDRGKAFVAGTHTLAGSLVAMDMAVRWLRFCTGSSAVDALEAASLKPAQLLGIENQKGTLKEGADADFILLDDHLHVQATFTGGKLAWQKEPLIKLE